ncbi:MAG: hypothetical protein DF168_00381 [Candidatus Moanabacter tarae]|uniref:Uncharacterized protein n=1 Tax=Candidatus Moanibacter tarae TaxID=2200854 RepID=A0A2Z4AKK2_9BACT|nr:MAG: hypothetical protein DF168_00381 [Candidatus Moanabacter tarae]
MGVMTENKLNFYILRQTLTITSKQIVIIIARTVKKGIGLSCLFVNPLSLTNAYRTLGKSKWAIHQDVIQELL